MFVGSAHRIALAVVLVALCSSSLLAQGRGRSGGQRGVQIGAGGQANTQQIQQQITAIGQQLTEGSSVLEEATEKATEVRGEYQKVETEHKQNLRELSMAKKAAEEEAKNSPELKAAREKVDGLRKELAEVRKKVIEKLKEDNDEYRKEVKAHEEAVAEQKANSGAGAPSDTRRALSKKVAEADKRVKTIEEVVMTDNSEAKAINASLKEANAEVGAAAKAKTAAIENDQRLSSAKVGFQRTRDALKEAKANLDQAEGEAGRIRSAMLALVNRRNALQAQLQTLQRMQSGGQNGGGQNRRY